MLKPGFRADVTVVDRDLFEVKPKELLASRIVATIVEGKVEFEGKKP
jgi:predicted amidohydrolase YtcJ